MKFTEAKLEQAAIELFEKEGYTYLSGEQIHKEITEVLLRDDLKQYLLNRYADENITLNEIEAIIRKLELYPSSALYESNKNIIKLIAENTIALCEALACNICGNLPSRDKSSNYWQCQCGKKQMYPLKMP